MPAVIEIFGDRQVGKTEMTMQTALLHAARGDLVCWLGAYKVQAVEVMRRYRDWWLSGHPLGYLIDRAYFGHGNEHVRAVGGGRIVFRSVRSPGRGVLPDVLILDDVLFPEECAPMAPKLKKIYSITCTED